jgi:hypothetical protein
MNLSCGDGTDEADSEGGQFFIEHGKISSREK